MTSTLLMAIAIALIIEGAIPALFPNKWRSYVLKVANEQVSTIQKMGLFIMCVGLVLLYIAN